MDKNEWVLIRMTWDGSGFPVVTVVQVFDGLGAEITAYRERDRLIGLHEFAQSMPRTKIEGETHFMVRQVGREDDEDIIV